MQRRALRLADHAPGAALTRYTFHSDCDCELLLPLYREYGLGMFSRLDAEFALVIYDGEKDTLIAARDPIGIRPLFYGYDHSWCHRLCQRGQEPGGSVRPGAAPSLPATTMPTASSSATPI